jgi:formate hydrogenlyase subunit 3/multisubunit Na+/H+ antiporter MnhD subunit
VIDPAAPPIGSGGAYGWLPVAAVFLPVVGALAAFFLGGRFGARLFAATWIATSAVAAAIGFVVLESGTAIVTVIGGWRPPLGIALRADGLSAAMLATTAVVIGGCGLYARTDFAVPAGTRETRRSLAFWTLLPGVWAALATVFLSNDLFTLFVALELLTFSAVPLVCLENRASTIEAALRYLLFALVGSMFYLLGTGLMYGARGTLDLSLLAGAMTADPVAIAAVALMTVGLLAKAALFPLYLWLPPAHGSAPPAASAILSALVVKGAFFVLLRLWLDVLLGVPTELPAQTLATLGGGAILVGSVLALRQARLKMLIAYSTVAQIGYLFLVFPLFAAAAATAGDRVAMMAVTGGMLQAISHACAKAAMFLAAGAIAAAVGHDRIADLGGVGRALPITVVALLIAGFSLMGLPPSGGFWAKWLLLSASIETGQWWWALTMILGGLLAGGYVFRVTSTCMERTASPPAIVRPISTAPQLVALALAIVSMLLGLLALAPPNVLVIGRVLPGGVTP